MNRTYHLFILLASLAALITYTSACVPPQPEEVITTIDINIQDSLFQQISDAQDQRQANLLYPYLRHPNPAYRYLAARAFASFTDTFALDSVALLLNDPLPAVREMAAFALGQSKNNAALPFLIRGFVTEDTAMVYAAAQRAILEAVGKCGTLKTLEQLASISTYTPRDTSLLEGQAWGIYRLGLQGITAEQGTRKMLEFIPKGTYPRSVRLIAANYLSRVAVPLDSLAAPLVSAFEQSTDPAIRMALAIAVGKSKQDVALTSLTTQYSKERDYRVKCNILRALANFPYENGRTLVAEAIRDRNEHVARQAAQYLLEKSSPEDATQWWRFAKDSLPTPIQVELYRVANRHLPAFRTEVRDVINFELRQQFPKATAYQQAAILQALGEFPWNYRFIFREGLASPHPVVRTAAVEALQQISDRPDFNAYFSLSARRITQEFATMFTQAIQTREPGPVAVAAQALRSEQHDYRPLFDSLNVLQAVLDSLELPTLIESYNELALTINKLQGKAAFVPMRPVYSHPIDWKLLRTYGNHPALELETNCGKVVISLWPTVAPGSVANLLALAKSGFLTDKAFHRVVANFVIQGGSPTGDAYGSLDYSIRSEFSDLHYNEEGLLGMASAGPDTEGTQFFITHSPTLHLDGNYTLFGKVTAGMDVIQTIQVGDRILSATIIPTQ